MNQEHKPRERSFLSELVPDWRPTRKQRLWAVRIAILLVVALSVLTLIGLPFGITLWEWGKLLIVPAVIALGGYLFQRSENRRAQVLASQRAKEDRALADQRIETDREIAEQRRQDDMLQAYLDYLGELTLAKDRPLRGSEEGDEVRTMARVRTLTVLRTLDGNRKATVLRFLYESRLIKGDSPIINLHEVDLRDVNLQEVRNLEGINLVGANLIGAILRWTNLKGANLGGDYLARAQLLGTDLEGADLRAAKLRGAYIADATLTRANLNGADLRDATVEGGNGLEAAVT